MPLKKSSEIRWFFKGNIPANIEAWFSSGLYNCKIEKIEDIYLKFSPSSNLGLKIREGKLEVKPKIEDLGNYIISDRLVGKLEIWEKWSSAGSVVDLSETIEGQNDWLPVKKERKIRKFIVDPAVIETDPKNEPEAGCTMEITNITINKSIFWTFAFEAHDKEGAGVDLLKDVIQYIMNEANFSKIGIENGKQTIYSADNSFSYPLFLCKIDNF